jgi:hypothetical protein
LKQGPNANALANLLQAGNHAAPWSSFAHRSYALWVYANYQLLAFLESGTYEPGELDCIIEYYNQARGFLRRGDNRELHAAILNNKALALYVKYTMEGDRSLRKRSVATLLQAVRTLREPDVFKASPRAATVARENLFVVKAGLRQQKKAKRRNAHGKLREKTSVAPRNKISRVERGRRKQDAVR